MANVVGRVVADRLDDARLDELYRIGVDEVSYRKDHRCLTIVADHDREGSVAWAAEGHNTATLKALYDELGEARKAKLQANSLDMGSAYAKATSEEVPHARQCVDPFQVVQLTNHHRRGSALGPGTSNGRHVRDRHAPEGRSPRRRGRCRPGRAGSSTSAGRCSTTPPG